MGHNGWMLALRSSLRLWIWSVTALCLSFACAGQTASAAHPERPQPPTRDPHTAGYVEAKELPDGAVPPANKDGNFILGPTHTPRAGVGLLDAPLKGRVVEFTMSSAESKFYPGIAREPGTFGTPDPNDPAKLIVTTSHAAPYTRKVAVYVPKQYVPGTAAPFIVGADGPDRLLFAALDGLIDCRNTSCRRCCHFDRQRQRRCAGQRARAGVRHDVGQVCGVCGEGGAAAGGERGAREADARSRGARGDGWQLGRVPAR